MSRLTTADIKKLKRSAHLKAKEYIAEKELYVSKVEKKALSKVRKAQEKEWKDSLAETNLEERIIQKRAYRYFKNRINLKRNLLLLGGTIFIVVILIIVIM